MQSDRKDEVKLESEVEGWIRKILTNATEIIEGKLEVLPLFQLKEEGEIINPFIIFALEGLVKEKKINNLAEGIEKLKKERKIEFKNDKKTETITLSPDDQVPSKEIQIGAIAKNLKLAVLAAAENKRDESLDLFNINLALLEPNEAFAGVGSKFSKHPGFTIALKKYVVDFIDSEFKAMIEKNISDPVKKSNYLKDWISSKSAMLQKIDSEIPEVIKGRHKFRVETGENILLNPAKALAQQNKMKLEQKNEEGTEYLVLSMAEEERKEQKKEVKQVASGFKKLETLKPQIKLQIPNTGNSVEDQLAAIALYEVDESKNPNPPLPRYINLLNELSSAWLGKSFNYTLRQTTPTHFEALYVFPEILSDGTEIHLLSQPIREDQYFTTNLKDHMKALTTIGGKIEDGFYRIAKNISKDINLFHLTPAVKTLLLDKTFYDLFRNRLLDIRDFSKLELKEAESLLKNKEMISIFVRDKTLNSRAVASLNEILQGRDLASLDKGGLQTEALILELEKHYPTLRKSLTQSDIDYLGKVSPQDREAVLTVLTFLRLANQDALRQHNPPYLESQKPTDLSLMFVDSIDDIDPISLNYAKNTKTPILIKEKQRRILETKEKKEKPGPNIKKCDLFVMSVSNHNGVEQKILNRAKEKKTPILIKEKNKFFVYGDKSGKGNWAFTEITQDLTKIQKELDELKKLPSNEKEINTISSPTLYKIILKNGHTEVTETIKFYVYGDVTGHGDWGFTEIKQQSDEFSILPFASGDVIKSNDQVFTQSLREKVAQGHNQGSSTFDVRNSYPYLLELAKGGILTKATVQKLDAEKELYMTGKYLKDLLGDRSPSIKYLYLNGILSLEDINKIPRAVVAADIKSDVGREFSERLDHQELLPAISQFLKLAQNKLLDESDLPYFLTNEEVRKAFKNLDARQKQASTLFGDKKQEAFNISAKDPNSTAIRNFCLNSLNRKIDSLLEKGEEDPESIFEQIKNIGNEAKIDGIKDFIESKRLFVPLLNSLAQTMPDSVTHEYPEIDLDWMKSGNAQKEKKESSKDDDWGKSKEDDWGKEDESNEFAEESFESDNKNDDWGRDDESFESDKNKDSWDVAKPVKPVLNFEYRFINPDRLVSFIDLIETKKGLTLADLKSAIGNIFKPSSDEKSSPAAPKNAQASTLEKLHSSMQKLKDPAFCKKLKEAVLDVKKTKGGKDDKFINNLEQFSLALTEWKPETTLDTSTTLKM